MACSVIDASTLALDPQPLDRQQVVAGAPRVAAVTLSEGDGPETGVWEHTAGTSTDVEADELFVVLSGRATVTVDGGPTLELRPGVVGFLEAGARTTWVVHESLRKVYVLR